MAKPANEVINEILDELEMKGPTFAKMIGLKYQRISDIQRGVTKSISGEVASAVKASFPQFNIEWILTGQGGMFVEMPDKDYVDNIVDNVIAGQEQPRLYPLIPIEAVAGFGEEDAQAVYITESEFERISSMKIESAERELIRDAFVANYCVGMRLSDFRKLTAENVRGGIVTRKTRKTGVTVEVPVHRLLKAILEKYGGNFPPYQKSSQNYNKVIKNICKQAGLNDKVLLERTRGHKVVRKTMKRFELVSSHTARRSFATNAYLAGIPTARIMLITGHKTEAAFFTYIRIDRKENARTLSDHAFFR